MTKPRGRRDRRPGEHSRQLILESARQLFVERGFTATGSRDIATASGVPERLIFRHFGTKQQLFDAAARAEITCFVDDFVAQWRDMEPATYDFHSLTSAYVTAFSSFSHTHGRLFADLMGLYVRPKVIPLESDSPFAGILDGLEELARTEARRHGLPEDRAGRNVRFTFALVLAANLLSRVLFESRDPGDDTVLLDELTAFILGGSLRP